MATTPTALANLAPIDIQAPPAYDQQSLARLIESLQLIESSVNQLVSAVTTLQQDGGGTTVPQHELAGEGGLGPVHTVSGLTAGQVLKALSSASAGFAQLALSELARMGGSVGAPENGDVLTFEDGYWVAIPAPGAETSQTYLTAANERATLPNSLALAPGAGITLVQSGDQLVVGSEEGVISGPPGTVLTGEGLASSASFQYPQDSLYTTFAGAA